MKEVSDDTIICLGITSESEAALSLFLFSLMSVCLIFHSL